MNLNGIYRGFSPTDESGVGLGELEVVISDDTISYRFATGLEVRSEQMSRSRLRQLSPDEVAARFNPGTNITGIVGYMLGEDGPIFLFLAKAPDAPEAPRVLLLRFVSDEVDSFFGPSYLFVPEQVEVGYFQQALNEIEKQQNDPGVIPKLANNGRRN
jgi:hypothetical protein